jgi:lipoate-protein ligase A
MKWQFLNTGAKTGSYNMRFDEELVYQLQEGGEISTVRVFGWKPPAISLGMHQNEKEVDADRANREGIDIVRRPTGGRAILHWNEITYSVVMLTQKKNVSGVYSEISRALLKGLRYLGVFPSFEKQAADFRTQYKNPSSAICFSSVGRYEIIVDGRKLVGSAQRRYHFDDNQEIVLQHGSILLGPEHKRIIEFLKFENEEISRTIAQELNTKTIDITEVLRNLPEFEEIAEAVKYGFENEWGITFNNR